MCRERSGGGGWRRGVAPALLAGGQAFVELRRRKESELARGSRRGAVVVGPGRSSECCWKGDRSSSAVMVSCTANVSALEQA